MQDKILKTIQELEKEALKDFSDFCTENQLEFFLRGGSVLGAVKYNDMVPWDDDIDVSLPRDDYDKLMNNSNSDFSKKFIFISYKNTKNSHCYFPRILLKEEYRIKYNLPKNNERGLVLIDVLPLDGMPSNNLKLKIHIFKAKTLRLLASVWTYGVKDTVSMHSSRKDKIIGFLYKLNIHHLYKQDDIYKKMDKLYSKYKLGENKNAGTIASSKMEKEVMNYSIWSDGVLHKFGENNYLIPKEYDLYLRKLFEVDYLIKDPTIENRNKSHIYRGERND